MRAPLLIEVYDRDFVHTGNVGAPKFVTVHLAHNKAGRSTIGVLGSDPVIAKLLTPGGRLWIKAVDPRTGAPSHLTSGYIEDVRGTGPGKESVLEFDMIDDFVLLEEVTGWVIPTALITAQGTAGANWEMTDNSETVLKAAVAANAVTRLSMPLTIAPDLGRGSVITAKLRFHPLFDRLFPVEDGAGLAASGIGVTIRQDGAGLLLDVYEPAAYPRKLSEISGTITNWNWSKKPYTASRVVVGGQGEAQARAFRYYTDAARELEGRIIERFRDARDVDDVADLPVRGQETLDDGAAKSGLSVTLAQTANFRYGRPGVQVGDSVRMEVGLGIPPIEDVLTEATLSWTQGEGFKVTPKVGDKTDDPDTLLSGYLARLARAFSFTNRT